MQQGRVTMIATGLGGAAREHVKRPPKLEILGATRYTSPGAAECWVPTICARRSTWTARLVRSVAMGLVCGWTAYLRTLR